MSQFLEDMQYKLKTSSGNMAMWTLKIGVGLFLGLTLALIFERIFHLGTFSFALIIFVTAGLFARLAKFWTLASLGVFTLICVLVGLILKMYIVIAPGA